MITLQIKTTTTPENRMEFIQTLQSLIEPILKEKGCKGISVLTDIINENSFVVEEKWATLGDYDLHQKADSLAVLLGAITCLCDPDKLDFITLFQADIGKDFHYLSRRTSDDLRNISGKSKIDSTRIGHLYLDGNEHPEVHTGSTTVIDPSVK
jgi:quinol monooxygenase YgiN